MGLFDNFFGPGEDITATKTQTQRQGLSPQGQQIVDPALASIQQFLQQSPQRAAVPGFTPQQEAGRGMVETAARGGQTRIAQGAERATADLLSPLSTIESDPAVSRLMEMSNRRLIEDFQQRVLPSLASGSIATGGVGGSRQGVAEGLATDALGRSLSDAQSQILSNAFRTALQGQTQALGLAPQTSQLQLAPGLTVEALGQQERNLQLEQQERDFQNQLLPAAFAREAIGAVAATPGAVTGETEVTAPVGREAGGFQKALGGAAAGASLGTAIGGPGVGTAVGAGLGALAGLLT